MAFCILKFIAGWTSVAINIKTITTIQIFVQDDFRGQVIGTLTAVSYVMQFLFYLDQLKELGFSIDVKRPPNHDGWECSVTFNGKDTTTSENADMCLFLEEFNEKREEYASYALTAQAYQNWKDKTLAYYANTTLSEKEVEELTEDERIKRRNALLDEQFGF